MMVFLWRSWPLTLVLLPRWWRMCCQKRVRAESQTTRWTTDTCSLTFNFFVLYLTSWTFPSCLHHIRGGNIESSTLRNKASHLFVFVLKSVISWTEIFNLNSLFFLPLVVDWSMCCRCRSVLPEGLASVCVASVWNRSWWRQQQQLTEGGACPQRHEDTVCPDWEDACDTHWQVHTDTHWHTARHSMFSKWASTDHFHCWRLVKLDVNNLNLLVIANVYW